ncbi:MAG: CDP-glycerol glycerophosphotransferase family protein [Longicatena sp.]
MGLEKAILMMLLSFLNLFKRWMPIQDNKITFISLTSDKLEQDFKEIDTLLRAKGCYDIHYNLTLFKKTLKGDFLYMLNCLKQLVEINTSRLIILNDNNFVVTKFKREGTQVLQIWHACGAVKKFGNQIQRQYPIQNYDYVMSNSEAWKHAYAEAFGVQEDQVIISGMPRADALVSEIKRNEYKQSFYAKYPQLRDKYIILYAPTFRGNIINGLRYEAFDVEKVIEQLPEDMVIVYKMHPLLKSVFADNARLINANDEELYMLMCASDCMISDYSSILFDYSLLGKKIICYTSDYSEYDKTIGFNIDYKNEMPCNICTSEKAVIQELLQKEEIYQEKLNYFQKKYMPFTDGRNAHRICEFIAKLLEK